jgi:hypothetical protein
MTLTLTKSEQTFDLPLTLEYSTISLIASFDYTIPEIYLLLSDSVEPEIVNNELVPVVAILPLINTVVCPRKLIRHSNCIRLEIRSLKNKRLELRNPITFIFKLE